MLLNCLKFLDTDQTVSLQNKENGGVIRKKNKHFVEALPSDASSDNANQEKSHELSIPKRVVKPPN